MKSKRLRVSLIIVSIVLILLAGLFTYYKLFMDPYRGSTMKNAEFSRGLDEMLSAREAKEDLTYMLERFRGHRTALGLL